MDPLLPIIDPQLGDDTDHITSTSTADKYINICTRVQFRVQFSSLLVLPLLDFHA